MNSQHTLTQLPEAVLHEFHLLLPLLAAQPAHHDALAGGDLLVTRVHQVGQGLKRVAGSQASVPGGGGGSSGLAAQRHRAGSSQEQVQPSRRAAGRLLAGKTTEGDGLGGNCMCVAMVQTHFFLFTGGSFPHRLAMYVHTRQSRPHT
jgi:hypothetical protein